MRRIAWRLAAFVAMVLVFSGIAVVRAEAQPVHVPERSAVFQLRVTRAVQERFGDTALVAQIAAQFHQESAWRVNVTSSAGAGGLGQFMPATAAWISSVCPDLGPPDRSSADWSIRATVCYRKYLAGRNAGATACDRSAFGLADYNGGEKWRRREQQLARDAGADPARWFQHVERFRSRSLAAWTENRGYVRRILTLIEPAYLRAGWAGVQTCT